MAREQITSKATRDLVSARIPGAVEVMLSRDDFMYYNWALALDRPILPFLMYTFVLLVLLGVAGIFPAARLYAFAALVPLMGYTVFVWLSSRFLWGAYPAIRNPKRYAFREGHYLVETRKGSRSVMYSEVRRVLESRRAFYLERFDGSADLIPKKNLADEKAFRAFIFEKVEEHKRSSFL